jgi:diacylglycerol kinase (ATP)
LARAGVLINPYSGRGNGKGVALGKMLAHEKHLTLRSLEDFSRLTSYLYEMSKDGVTDLFISSGDGTVQAIQTLLAEKSIFDHRPNICLLPHGSTNLTASDLGFKHRNLATQKNFITHLQPTIMRSRATLRVVNPAAGGVRHGMALGLGAAAEATRHAQLSFNDKGVKGNFASFATIGSSIAKSLVTTAKPDDQKRFDRAYQIKIWQDRQLICEGPQLMLIATTLEKMFFGAKPFWGGGNGPLRVSVFPYPAPNMLRWLLPIMYGSENRKMPKGALSFSSDSFAIETPHGFVMDGEFFDPPKAGPLKVEAGPIFNYICG